MDPLDDVLPTLLLRGMVLYRGCLTAPYGVRFSRSRWGVDASFHVVLRGGRCLLTVEEEDAPVAPLWLEAGDLVLFPHGHAHSLRDAPSSPVRDLEALLAGARIDEEDVAHFGGGGAATETVCGTFRFQDSGLPAPLSNPLLAALPPVLLVRGEAGRAVPWLEATVGFLVAEAGRADRPGAQTVMSRLTDLLFIQAVRAFLADACDTRYGGGSWLRALGDPDVGPALAAIHRDPAAEWTVAAMAREAGMSRSAFAERFSRLAGEPPLHYLTRWRLHTAARLLRETPGLSLGQVAERVGYASEAALGNAFKRWAGVSPGAYRRRWRERYAPGAAAEAAAPALSVTDPTLPRARRRPRPAASS